MYMRELYNCVGIPLSSTQLGKASGSTWQLCCSDFLLEFYIAFFLFSIFFSFCFADHPTSKHLFLSLDAYVVWQIFLPLYSITYYYSNYQIHIFNSASKKKIYKQTKINEKKKLRRPHPACKSRKKRKPCKSLSYPPALSGSIYL